MARVLVADDSETILLLLRTRLEMEGHDVETAGDGQEAIEAIDRSGTGPDLILLDAMMPRKSGIDVLRELRGRGSETPILIVSAHRQKEDICEGNGDGADGYLTKPIDFDLLLSRIAELTAAA